MTRLEIKNLSTQEEFALKSDQQIELNRCFKKWKTSKKIFAVEVEDRFTKTLEKPYHFLFSMIELNILRLGKLNFSLS